MYQSNRRWLLPLLLLIGPCAPISLAQQPQLWSPDNGDGTYKNPIIFADYSDPDVIRVGNDFYLTASSFSCFPGLPILHSMDLVNWTIIGHAINKYPVERFNTPVHGCGVWAPAIRFHDGQFYIFFGDPDNGIFMAKTTNPTGPWNPLVRVKDSKGWIDTCPFWDDDGQAYLVHSHKGAGPLLIARMSTDGTHLLEDDGTQVYMAKGAEGPKLYKRHGYYYVSFPEGGVATGGQIVIRSKNIFGPYERHQVLPNGSPHQGGMVELDNGQAWFISFKSVGYLGRITYLNPVTWGNDDWPVFGDNGKSVDIWKKPDVGAVFPIQRPQTSDEFDSAVLNPIWQWNHNPVNDHWSLTEHPGYLRLTALPADSLAVARNTLTDKLIDSTGVIDVKLDITHMADGQRAGFAFVSGNNFGPVGVIQDNGVRRVFWNGDNGKGSVVPGSEIWLLGVNTDDKGGLWYSLDGKNFVDTGAVFTMKFIFWKGGRIGLFSYGPHAGSADFDFVHYRYGEGTVQ